MRDTDLQRLIDATAAAFAAAPGAPPPLQQLSRKVFEAAAAHTGDPLEAALSKPLPVCHHLAPALVRAATASPETAAVANAFSNLAPRLHWHERIVSPNDPAGFSGNHANATILGVDGLEQRDDIRIGASLMAPHTIYPDHRHPPEEIYLVLSDGEWRNAETDWHAPGIGGSVHNPPGIEHAMRSGNAPLFAIWCLCSP